MKLDERIRISKIMKPLQNRTFGPTEPFFDRWLLRVALVVMAVFGTVQIAFAVRWWLS